MGIRRLKRPPWSVWLAVFSLVILFLGIFLWAPHTGYDPTATSLLYRLQPPGPQHLLGTDELGRDIWTRLLYGGQASLSVAFAASVIGLSLGVALGVWAAFWRGSWLEQLIMYLIDVQLSLPFILLAIVTALVLGSSLTVVVGLAALAVWPSYARLTYGLSLSWLERDFVAAARVQGANAWHLTHWHLLPNLLAPLAVLATLNISAVILLESALSFIGLGIQPPTPSWGNMIGDGREYLLVAWWLVGAPAALLVALTIALGVIGDWLRDALDVTLP